MPTVENGRWFLVQHLIQSIIFISKTATFFQRNFSQNTTETRRHLTYRVEGARFGILQDKGIDKVISFTDSIQADDVVVA